MATRVAPAAKKTTYHITAEHFENFYYDCLEGMACCAFVEFDGLSSLNSVEHFIALRRLASGDVVDLDPDGARDIRYSTDGMVLVTTVSSQANKYPLLRAAGFKELTSFTRHNPTRTIKLWGARTLKPGKVTRKQEAYEEITI